MTIAILLLLHGTIHLLGFVKEWNLALKWVEVGESEKLAVRRGLTDGALTPETISRLISSHSARC